MMRNIKYKRIFLFILLIFTVIAVAGQDSVVATNYTNYHEFDSDSAVLSANYANLREFHSDSAVIRFLSDQGVPITKNNEVQLLNGGKEKFDDLFQRIETAKHHIHLEYFNFRNDSIAGLLFNLLAKKAKEGVEIRAVYDAFGNWSNNMPLKKKHLDTIRKSGIQIFPFDPLYFPFINHISCRDHRKIVIIDGKTAYVGGINVADYYIEGLPKTGEWRDMHARIEGSAAGYLQKIFLTMWNEVSGDEIDGIQYYPSHSDIDGKTVAIIDRVPKKLPRQLEETYLKSISSAKNRIRIINPYFLPTSAIKKALRKAIERNVKVEIMISAKLDIKFTPDGVFHVAKKLMKKGADIYIYNTGIHHSKIMMIDNKFCTVGSANLDYRSLRHDYETNAFIFDEEITAELNSIFDDDIKKSTKMTPEIWKKRSLWKRFTGWIANGLSPVL